MSENNFEIKRCLSFGWIIINQASQRNARWIFFVEFVAASCH